MGQPGPFRHPSGQGQLLKHTTQSDWAYCPPVGSADACPCTWPALSPVVEEQCWAHAQELGPERLPVAEATTLPTSGAPLWIQYERCPLGVQRDGTVLAAAEPRDGPLGRELVLACHDIFLTPPNKVGIQVLSDLFYR